MSLDPVTTVDRDWNRLYNEFPEKYDEFAEAQDTTETMQYLQAHVDLTSKTVLDIGGGTGKYARRLAALAAHVHCFDPCQPLLGVAARRAQELGLSNLDVQQAEAQQVPLVDEAVDVVLAAHSISAIAARDFSTPGSPSTDAAELRFNERARAVTELLRVLRPGGWLFSLTPAPNNYGGELSGLVLGANNAEWSRGKQRFIRWMSDRYGFVSAPVRADWQFTDPDEAARVFGFVYGDKVADHLRAHRIRTIDNHLVIQTIRKPVP
jgi:ubiquinone/menaquinone biosynthesis C-methylase UbiE